MRRFAVLAPLLVFACGEAPGADAGPSMDRGVALPDAGPLDAGRPDAGSPVDDGPLEVVVPVGPDEAYGTRTFRVPAQANWVNSGLYLRAGETATVTATGSWVARSVIVGPEGNEALGDLQRGCPVGALAVRSGLRFEDAVACGAAAAAYVAPRDGIVFVGMIESTDLGEAYHERRDLDGELDVTITSDGATAPVVRAADIAGYPFADVASGWVEVMSEHHRIVLEAAQVEADRATAVDALATLDTIYDIEEELRGAAPFDGQRVRWYPDETIADFAYMLAGNPIRCAPGLMNGTDNQRILRADEGPTDIWGFAHELGHVFSFIEGTWVYQIVNLESWPNIFTLRALRTLGRTEGQPNIDTFCDGRAAYLDGGEYETFADDPFVQLCFLMEMEETYGEAFYESFFREMLTQNNGDVLYDGSDESVWRYVEERFDLAAGESTAAIWDRWRVPR